jgi:hypothetical protein
MTDDLCVPCISLVGGDRRVAPHSDLRQAEESGHRELFRCVACDARWSLQKLGWGRVILRVE